MPGLEQRIQFDQGANEGFRLPQALDDRPVYQGLPVANEDAA